MITVDMGSWNRVLTDFVSTQGYNVGLKVVVVWYNLSNSVYVVWAKEVIYLKQNAIFCITVYFVLEQKKLYVRPMFKISLFPLYLPFCNEFR